MLDIKSLFEVIGAFFFAAGGATVIVLGLAKWFGDFLSKRLLDNYNNKHSNELESIKSKWQTELEITKAELEKTRAKYARYSEKQFEAYNSFWLILQQTKRQADSLWENPIPEKIRPFAEQMRQTRNALNDNMLLIESAHYKQLSVILDSFEKFSIGKTQLSSLVADVEGEVEADIQTSDVEKAVRENRRLKNSYNKLIDEIADSLREHIKS